MHHNQQLTDLAQNELDQTQQKLMEMKNIYAEKEKRLLANRKWARSQLKHAQKVVTKKNLSSKRKRPGKL